MPTVTATRRECAGANGNAASGRLETLSQKRTTPKACPNVYVVVKRPSGETFGIPWILLRPGMPTTPRSSRSSLLLDGMYPPRMRPVILTVLPHGVRFGVTRVSSILAGVTTVADPVAGSTVGEPA